MNKYKIIIFSLFVLVQYSCNKTLDPKVYSSLTSANAFVTKSDAIAGVNSVYARLKGPAVGDNFDYWTVRHFALTDLTTDLGIAVMAAIPASFHWPYGIHPMAYWQKTGGRSTN